MKATLSVALNKQISALLALVLMSLAVQISAAENKKNLSGGVVSGGSISAGTATYSITSYSSTIGVANDLIISDGVMGDLMFESAWLYRTNTDSEEKEFPAPDAEAFAVDHVLLSWSDVASLGQFSAELLIEIDQPVAQSAILSSTMIITNISATDVAFDVFRYEDLDAGGTFGNDVATLIHSPDYIEIIDGADFAEFRGGAVTNYQVTQFPALRTQLIDNNINNLNNSGLPMALGDFTGAFQWAPQTIPPNGTYHLQTITAFKVTAPEPFVAFVDLIFANGYE